MIEKNIKIVEKEGKKYVYFVFKFDKEKIRHINKTK
jgi:hypothetical protein